MNAVCNYLGLSLPSTTARSAVMAVPAKKCASCYYSKEYTTYVEYDDKLRNDDDTASTVSTTTTDDDFFSYRAVTFAEPLVTKVYERPRTTKEEKRVLFYSDEEYLEFRLDAHCGRRRNRLVKFADSIVSNVWTVPSHEGDRNLFYSEGELQEFLDEFVASLDQTMVY